MSEPKWQPRDTAPTNESVLVYMPYEGHYGEGIYRAIQVDMGTGRHWQITGLHMGRDVQDNRITHWMPLPNPPTKEN